MKMITCVAILVNFDYGFMTSHNTFSGERIYTYIYTLNSVGAWLYNLLIVEENSPLD